MDKDQSTKTKIIKKHKQIFYDPSGNRWKVSILFGTIVAVFISIALFIGVPIGINILAIQSQINKNYQSQSLQKIPSSNKTFGIMVNNEQRSLASLKENMTKMDHIVLTNVEVVEENNQILVKNVNNGFIEAVNENINKNNPNFSKSLLISDLDFNKGSYQNRDNSKIFGNLITKPELHDGFINSLVNILNSQGYKGVVLDIGQDSIGKNNSEYNLLLEKIYKTLGSQNLTLESKINIFASAQTIEIVSKNSNSIILEMYQEDIYSKNPADEIKKSDQEIVKNPNSINSVIDKLTEINKKFPNLNYSIILPTQSVDLYLYNGAIGWQSELSFGELGEIIKKYQPEIKFDKDLGFASFEYMDDQNQNHRIIVNDATTVYNYITKINSQNKKPKAIGLEKIGYEEPISWDIINSSDWQTQQNLIKNNFLFETGLDVIGKGVINSIQKEPVLGTREIKIDNNQIVNSKITKQPEKGVVQKSGYKKGYIALTFDDGPDPKYTNKILDILNQNEVKGSFFALGQNVLDYPEIAERIVRDGHLLGNHTFSHLRMKNMDAVNFVNEVTNTQNSIKEITSTVPEYFRTPYNDFGSFETNNDLRPLRMVEKMQLKVSETDLDSLDYQIQDKKSIIDNVTKGLESDNISQILMHDTGGTTRQATIDALPEVIKLIKNKDIKIVTVDKLHELSIDNGQTKQTPKTNSFLNTSRLLLLQLFSRSDMVFRILLFIATALGMIRLCVLLIGLLRHFQGKKISDFDLNHIDFPPPVSVLIPCYNEEKVICNTINSILVSSYPDFEVIVIDDCSTDGSLALVRKEFGQNNKVKIVTKPNGGKAEALNYGITFAKYEYIVSMDADTMFLPNTIPNMMQYFADPKVGGVAGFVEIGNDYFYQKGQGQKARFNWLTTCQRLEYIFGQNFDKQAYDGLGCVIVVPGAIGAWRKQIILDVGGYKTDTLAEDTDLTVRILRNGWNVEYCKDAFCITEAPETIHQFWKQRVRWQFGTLQVIVKNLDIIFKPKHKAVSMFAIPYLFFNFFSMLVSPIANLPFLLLIIKLLVGDRFPFLAFSASDQDSLFWMYIFISGYLIIEYVSTIFAIWQYKGTNKWIMLIFIPLQIIVFRLLILVITINSIKKAFEGKAVGWGHLQRTGNVQAIGNQIIITPNSQV